MRVKIPTVEVSLNDRQVIHWYNNREETFNPSESKAANRAEVILWFQMYGESIIDDAHSEFQDAKDEYEA